MMASEINLLNGNAGQKSAERMDMIRYGTRNVDFLPLKRVASFHSGGTPSKAVPAFWEGDALLIYQFSALAHRQAVRITKPMTFAPDMKALVVNERSSPPKYVLASQGIIKVEIVSEPDMFAENL